MKIGIDARLIEETGVGRYIRNLIDSLARIDTENRYVVFLRKKSFDSFIVPNNRWEKRLADVPWHSITEQFAMSWIFMKEHLDLLHVPYFNIPIFYPGKLVVTIHDLTILHFDTGKATTLPMPLYKLRRLGYYLVLAVGLVRALRVIGVSHTVKQEIMDHFHIPAEKIEVTYEGVDNKIYKSANGKSTNKRSLIEGKYFLYVGNAYPHKNLETLLWAVSSLPSARLVLVGKEDYFYQRLKKLAEDTHLSDRIVFFDYATDKELASLYRHAIALVFPSRMEGFGLPGLEAMAHGTPVVCSDIPVFHEIYGDAALFADTKNPEKLAGALANISSDQSLRAGLIKKGKIQAARFEWIKMAEQTLKVYTTNSS